jgi:hypothetical protein
MSEGKTTDVGGRQSAEGALPNAGAPKSTPVRDVVLFLLVALGATGIELVALSFFDR